MGETNHLQALRRLAKQADAQISAQLEMIDGLMRVGLPTDEADEALRVTRRTATDLHGRLTGTFEPDDLRRRRSSIPDMPSK